MSKNYQPSYNSEIPESNKQESAKSESKDSPLVSKDSSGDKFRAFPASSKEKRETSCDTSSSPEHKLSLEAIESKVEDFGHELKRRGQNLNKQISNQIKANPWAYLGGVAVGSWIIGHLMARRKQTVKHE